MGDENFNIQDAINKIENNPICYLTGQSINLLDTKTYQLDHIIPISKGGKSTLENMGLTTKIANQCKKDLTPQEFLELCLKIVKHHGYEVNKTINTP